VDAEKRTLIKSLPHTLVLHLKRFEWDYETYQRWKVSGIFFALEDDLLCCSCKGLQQTRMGRAALFAASKQF